LEYGLIPLEANASGTPVICLGKGGVTEIMLRTVWCNCSQKPTAVFFLSRRPMHWAAVLNFERYKFSSADCHSCGSMECASIQEQDAAISTNLSEEGIILKASELHTNNTVQR
jgi:hypothetical protein